MRIRLRIKAPTVEDTQANKRQRFLFKLNKKSDKVRRQEIVDAKTAAFAKLPPLHADKSLVLNKSGDLRGLHMREIEGEELSDRMKRVRAMRRFYNKQMPVQQCNGCAFSAACPQYKAGFECAFLPYLNSHKIDTLDDVRHYMREMAAASMRRAHWLVTTETLSGGAPSLENSEAMGMAFNQLKELHTIESKSDDDLEIEIDGGIIGQIFGGLKHLVEDTKLAHAKPLEAVIVQEQDEQKFLSDGEDHSADVNHDLLNEFSKAQLLSRTIQPAGSAGMIEVSNGKIV